MSEPAQPVAICPRCGTPQPVVWMPWDDQQRRIEFHNRRDLEHDRWIACGGSLMKEGESDD